MRGSYIQFYKWLYLYENEVLNLQSISENNPDVPNTFLSSKRCYIWRLIPDEMLLFLYEYILLILTFLTPFFFSMRYHIWTLIPGGAAPDIWRQMTVLRIHPLKLDLFYTFFSSL